MEETSQFSPENSGGQFSFKVGEEGFGFDGGFTDGRFAGVIRGTDGKEFTGLVEDLGDGRYRIEDWDGDRIIEPAAEAAAEVPATAAEMPVGLEEAAAAVAMEAAAQPEPAPVVIPAAGVVEQPAEEAAAPAEAVAPASVKELRLAHMPEPAESSEASSIHPAIKNTIDRLQEIRREVAPQAEESKRLLAVEAEAKNLRQKAEKARESVKKLRRGDRINEKIAEEWALIKQAKELEEKVGLARSQDKYKEMDEHKAWKLEARKDATIVLETDLGQWEAVMKNPEDFNFYRQVFEKWQKERGKAGSMRDQVDQKFKPLLAEFEQRLPWKLLELAGFVNPRPEGGQKGVDDDIWVLYNQTANQLYAELVGQPVAAPELPVAPEPVAPPETVTGPVVEPAAEAGGEPVAEPVAVEAAPEPVAEQVAEVTAPPVAEEEPPAPMEAPVPGQVVVDADERARAAAAKPAGADEDVPVAPTEAPAPGEVAGETPEQRFERRKQGFAGAVAELDRARGDTSGTEGEQRVRLAEAYNQAIGAAMEFMEESDAAKEVVKGFFAGALGTPGGRKLTEVAVRSRLDQAGVLGAATPEERKKKLEEYGLLGLITLLIELGMSFSDKAVGAVVSEVQSATGSGR